MNLLRLPGLVFLRLSLVLKYKETVYYESKVLSRYQVYLLKLLPQGKLYKLAKMHMDGLESRLRKRVNFDKDFDESVKLYKEVFGGEAI